MGGEDWAWQLLELLAAMEAPGWHARAACLGVGTEVFFPPVGRHDLVGAAKRLCASCPVRVECATAGEYSKQGIWAGETYNERKRRYQHSRTRPRKAA